MLKPDFTFIHTVTITEYKGKSGTGKSIYKDPYDAKCRIEPSARKVTDMNGNEVVAGGRIMMTAGTRLNPGTKIKWEGREYELIKLEPAFSFVESHVEGWFK